MGLISSRDVHFGRLGGYYSKTGLTECRTTDDLDATHT
jgi:hypothetical protein